MISAAAADNRDMFLDPWGGGIRRQDSSPPAQGSARGQYHDLLPPVVSVVLPATGRQRWGLHPSRPRGSIWSLSRPVLRSRAESHPPNRGLELHFGCRRCLPGGVPPTRFHRELNFHSSCDFFRAMRCSSARFCRSMSSSLGVSRIFGTPSKRESCITCSKPFFPISPAPMCM